MNITGIKSNAVMPTMTFASGFLSDGRAGNRAPDAAGRSAFGNSLSRLNSLRRIFDSHCGLSCRKRMIDTVVVRIITHGGYTSVSYQFGIHSKQH